MRLKDKVAIVTGGNQGIGQATVHRFAEEGARVAILARREDEGRAVEAAVRDQGGDATFIPCDVTDRQQIAAAAAVAAVPNPLLKRKERKRLKRKPLKSLKV